ncbi:SusC/RagA family TonB-linked outer membrane protein [Dyadobacter psychrotolerans]|uniref:SusC/RagA family TonB-linked outer membrane protein n=1 Tax=Dyadobacter psychrotolerans TaxID=2541721 RepID=A0A4R5E1Y5_9BACT|nr:TonB-dependent receptor [Dyadobacter psychrotolerans]TDE18185.1 SusC/RagA family TonB-linked outer membrane protein [Dyadobacter psychrotolerans]
MKVTLVPFLITLLFSSLSLASNGLGQELLNRQVSIQADQQALKIVLASIEKSTKVKFSYVPSLVQNQKVSISASNQQLDVVLEQILTPLQIKYTVSGNYIILNKKPAPAATEEPKTGVITPLPNSPKAEITIKGTVRDPDDKEFLTGVSVILKGSSQGTTTDGKGAFEINVPNENAVLVFSFVGYTSFETTVGNRSRLDIDLRVDPKSLEEVVVVGYGTQKKENLTGAVSTVTSREIENRPVSNLAMALQGLSPGLSITRQTGQPGEEGIGIQVRGATSANGNVEPLLIVDGVSSPGVSLQALNPNDIESVTVLKDAAAAAIYGAQAAGGVILVTSKKGKSGKTVFEFSSIVGTDWALNVPERMPTWEELEYNNMARLNSGAAAAHSAETIAILKEGKITYRVNPNDTTRYQYYGTESIIDQLLRKNTLMQTHNISARGGTDKLNFLVSLGYYDKQGVFKVGPDKNNRYNLRLNLGTQLTKHLSLDSRITYTLQKQEAPSVGTNGNGALLFNLYRYSSQNPLLTPDGRYNTTSGATAYAQMDAGGFNNYNRNFFDGVFTARLNNFVKGLEVRAIYGAQYRRGDRDIFKRTVQRWYRTAIGDILNTPNSYSVTNDVTQNTNLQFLVDYDLRIAKNHKFHVLGGYQWEDSRFEEISTGVTNMVSNELPSLGLGDETTKTNSQRINTYAFQSYFGRFNYSYADRYLFEATFRVDESSRLAPGLRTKAFPSLSAGWNIHRESWFSVPFVSELKLRGSWGRLGAASGIGLYDYLALMNRNANLVLGSPEVKSTYFAQTTVPSSQLSWETIETTNGGLDIGLFKNKVSASLDYYVKYNRNMLSALQLPATFGVGTPRVNNGELKSWGWEAELRYRDRIGDHFTFNVGLNVSDNQNKLINFAGRRVISAGTVGTLEGYPINSIWGYKTDGYFQTNDEVKTWAFQDSRTAAGDVKYIDVNGDKRISVGSGSSEDHGDLVYQGTTQPRYLFGFNLNMQWKGFDFTAFLQGVGKRNFVPTRQALDPNIASYYQALAVHRDYWTPENPNAMFPRPFVNATHNYLTADKWILDGKYVRLKNIQVGYSLRPSLLSKVKIARARIYFTGQDLFTLSGLGKFRGYFDPEQRDGVAADYPFFATAAVGLNLTF